MTTKNGIISAFSTRVTPRPDVYIFNSLWSHRSLILLILDAVTVFFSFLLAYYVRSNLELHIDTLPNIGKINPYIKGATLFSLMWVFLIWRDGGYRNNITGLGNSTVNLRSVFVSGFHALLFLMVISFLYSKMILSRMVCLMGFAFAVAAVFFVRRLFTLAENSFAEKGIHNRNLVIVGSGNVVLDFIRRLDKGPYSGKIVGHILWNGNGSDNIPKDKKILGRLENIRQIHEKTSFNTLIIPSPEHSHRSGDDYRDTVMEVINFCEEKNISLYMLAGSYDVAVTQQEIESIWGMPIIRLQDAALHPAYAIIKRFMDICISLVVLTIGAPLWVAIAIIIKISSDGPVFFIQKRAGFHGLLFKIIKFRTMTKDAEADLKKLINVDELEIPGYKIKNDPRVTPLGRFLRRTGLDEIPQFLNVLIGEMSIVGPRPEMPGLVERYTHNQRRRLKAKPGITGYQQIKARGLPLASGVQYDLFYLKHQSLLFDLYIMIMTMWVILRGKGISH